MRNKNKDIVIHSLIRKAENRKRLQGTKFDAAEEIRIEQQRVKEVKDLCDKQAYKEARGHFVFIERGNFKCRILVNKGEDEDAVIERFITKMEKQGRKLV